jgi:DNA invertase Pin-like site-specific DNA recombinase
MKIAIAYYRVSTERQGKSGLGLEAQQAAVTYYCRLHEYDLIQEIQEIKSTRKERPRLREAFKSCFKMNATLIVARLDRLGRDVEEIAHNVKKRVDIVVTDNPYADRVTIHILAAVAEEQRRIISETTKVALQAAKLRGTQLGKHGKVLAQKNKQVANEFAQQLVPLLKEFTAGGIKTYRAISDEMNRRKVPTFRPGSRWHIKSVYNVLSRINNKVNVNV